MATGTVKWFNGQKGYGFILNRVRAQDLPKGDRDLGPFEPMVETALDLRAQARDYVERALQRKAQGH